MTELEIIPQEAKDRIEQISSAQIAIGLFDCDTADILESAAVKVENMLRLLSPDLSAVLMHCAGPESAARSLQPNGHLHLLAFPSASLADPLQPAGRSPFKARRALFAMSHLLGAEASVVVGTEPGHLSAENLGRLVQPILDQSQDLVVGCYERHKFANLINTGIVYPLLRALYGKHVQWPMARDFGLARRLVERNTGGPAPGSRAGDGSPAQIVTEAICGGFHVCQAYLGTRLETPAGGGDLSSALAQVLGPIFVETERNAAFWQKLRGSQPIFTVGRPEAVEEESSPIDVSRMVESFQLSFRNLQEVWNQALSPATILGMKKLTRLTPDQFRMPDELWVRIIYDFALAFHLRVINRDHLLRALTPAYLAWVASYALEVREWSSAAVEGRIERLCGVYEAEKPYFQSRWRWPDRFNP